MDGSGSEGGFRLLLGKYFNLYYPLGWLLPVAGNYLAFVSDVQLKAIETEELKEIKSNFSK